MVGKEEVLEDTRKRRDAVERGAGPRTESRLNAECVTQ